MEATQSCAVEQSAKNGCTMASSFPVFLPEDPCLRMSDKEFEEYISKLLPISTGVESETAKEMGTVKATQQSSTESQTQDNSQTATESIRNTFLYALGEAALGVRKQPNPELLAFRNRALTENHGVTFASTESPLVDLFHTMDGEWTKKKEKDLTTQLDLAWKEDPLACLKLIWNTRSIHLGKGNRHMFYITMGWLKEHHPQTLLINLQWLFRPVIEKNSKPSADKEFAIIEKLGSTPDDHEVVHGVPHGYWKDLLNILALSASGKLNMSDPRALLLTKAYQRSTELSKRRLRKRFTEYMTPEEFREWVAMPSEDRIKESLARDQRRSLEAKKLKRCEQMSRHKRILDRLSSDPFHRALHLTVARLFAENLRKDMLLLQTGTKEQQRELSLCGKWAPSLRMFHDKNTLIATTIAEILFTKEKIGQPNDTREMYLKRAREQYRFWTTSKLRKALQCVECDISANTLSNIRYDRVPSLAMDQYKELFAKKDGERFQQYLRAVAEGKAMISGAVLMPGPLVTQALTFTRESTSETVVNLQWKTLVQRIKDCGSLSNPLAICDVSGSMLTRPRNGDTTLMDIAMGLSLIISEVTQPPFGGNVMTFSADPRLIKVGSLSESCTFKQQLDIVRKMPWGFNTDFLKVFELILDVAVRNEVSAEDMVKQIFVLSDMEFDVGAASAKEWDTHHQIITKKFADAGYETPELVYWNLSSRAGRHAPVTHDMPGTALISGHSQAMIKVFLDSGSLDVEAEEEPEVENDGDWGVVDLMKKKRRQITPYSVVMKAIGNKAYDMLTVVD
ncbi:hypothetical protein PRK78_005642 [Emydomyces testavorans]|uniref:DUF2828 domain-containing protein n=1 Tax=Emydomyces testavorans TaxID=2070801 RepID=A0AAF0DM39_9EURO|nr:hypothetical protein PRK78_005642 [Emydomyces testavorans]